LQQKDNPTSGHPDIDWYSERKCPMVREDGRIPVSQAALLRRINRRLVVNGEKLRRTRGKKAVAQMGSWHVLDIRARRVVDGHVDIEELAREIGVLREWEFLAKE
jgi:hypothetical protein